MNQSWYKAENDNEAEKHKSDFWSRHRDELQAGEFWADRIKKLRGEPVKRLSLAMENLPLPASFKEAAIATRALIREKRKQKADYSEELALLYWLAAINSFSIPYSKVLQEPGYNVIESIPGKKLKGLEFSYKSLGYESLELLNKTDIKWFIEQWGQPEKHTTLHIMHNNVWCEHEEKLKNKRKRQDQEFINSLSNSYSSVPPAINPKSKAINTSKWLVMFITLFVLIAIVYKS